LPDIFLEMPEIFVDGGHGAIPLESPC